METGATDRGANRERKRRRPRIHPRARQPNRAAADRRAKTPRCLRALRSCQTAARTADEARRRTASAAGPHRCQSGRYQAGQWLSGVCPRRGRRGCAHDGSGIFHRDQHAHATQCIASQLRLNERRPEVHAASSACAVAWAALYAPLPRAPRTTTSISLIGIFGSFLVIGNVRPGSIRVRC